MASLKSFLGSFAVLFLLGNADADVGVRNSDGCHTDGTTGVYHCHHDGELPTYPDPWQRPESGTYKLEPIGQEVDSWKNIGELGYASAGVFGAIELHAGEKNFQGVDQNCQIAGNSGLGPQDCNIASSLIDLGAFGEANIELFDMEEFGFFVGAEIGRAKSWRGKFVNCRADEFDWERCSSDRKWFRGSRGTLDGYTYSDVKLGIAGYPASYLAQIFGNIDGHFGFVYLSYGEIEYSSEWGKLSESELGIGLDMHFARHSSARFKLTNKRLSLIVRGHF